MATVESLLQVLIDQTSVSNKRQESLLGKLLLEQSKLLNKISQSHELGADGSTNDIAANAQFNEITQITIQKWYNNKHCYKYLVLFRKKDYDNPKFTKGKDGSKKKNGYHDMTTVALNASTMSAYDELPNWLDCAVGTLNLCGGYAVLRIYDSNNAPKDDCALIVFSDSDMIIFLMERYCGILRLVTNTMVADRTGKRMEYFMFNRNSFSYI